MNTALAWTDRDLEEARQLQRKLRAVFNSRQPFADESARTVTEICDQALLTIPDEYCQEMFCEVDRYAQKLALTGRRHPAALRVVLDAIQHRLGSLQMLRRARDRIASSEVTLAKY